MLTQLETRVLASIEKHFAEHGHSPTIAEIASDLQIKSRGTVHRYVHSLIDKGSLLREGTGWRGLALAPKVAAQLVGQEAGPADEFKIPFLGKIAAGLPIEAISNEEHLDLAGFFIGPDRYALRVTGDSMMDVGILDGDTVIVRKQSTAKTGDIVVALIDSHEATLKRLGQYSGESIELIPENVSMSVMLYAASRVALQGVVVGQMRSY